MPVGIPYTNEQFDQVGIAFLGDSRLAQMFDHVSAFETRYSAQNFLPISNAIMGGQRWNNRGNFAVSGARSDQYLAPALVSEAFATNAKYLMIYGIVNDILNTGNTIDYWNVNIKPVVLAWIERGGTIILPTESGDIAFAGVSADMAACIMYNQQIRQFCQENPNAILFDIASIVLDPTITWEIKTAYTQDQIHINTVDGAYAVAKGFADLMDPLLPYYDGMVPNAGQVYANGRVQFFNNPVFNITSGGTGATGVTGTIPFEITGWPVLPSGWAIAVSTTPGPYANDLVLTITATGAGLCQMQMDMGGYASISAGDHYYGNCEIVVASGATNFQYVGMQLQTNIGGTTYFSQDATAQQSGGGNLPNTGVTLDLSMPDLIIPTGTPNWFTGYLLFYFSGAGSVTLNIRRIGFWRRQNS